MNAITRKEIRLLMPAVLAGVLLSALPFIIGAVVQAGSNVPRATENPISFPTAMLCGLGALMVSLSVFGQEISTGTLGLFLVQPLPRKELWAAKMRVLSVSVAVVLALPLVFWAYWAGPHWWSLLLSAPKRALFSSPLPLLVVVLTAISSGLWTTLAVRQVAAAFWIALIVPLGLIMPPLMFLDRYPALEPWTGSVAAGVLALYSVAGFWFARSLFLRAQDVSWSGGTLSFTLKGRTWLPLLSVLPRGPVGALIRKELQLQQVAFLIAGVMVLWQLACFMLQKMIKPEPGNMLFEILQLSWILWLVVPFAVGGAAVADERRLNTLEGALCLPVSRRTQFAVKLVTTLLVGALLGGALPAIMIGLGMGAGPDAGAWVLLGAFCAVSAGLTGICLYGSSLTRNLLQALAASIAVAAGVFVVGQFLLFLPRLLFSQSGSALFWNSWVLWAGVVTLGIVTLLWLPYRNFVQVRPTGKLWRFNLATIGTVMASVTLVDMGVASRSWELVFPVEPRHGTAQLAGPVRPKVVERYGLMMALLPDGRLWLAQKLETRILHENISFKEKGLVPMVIRFPTVPVSGTFVGSSNWVDVAASGNEAVAIRADGTLWRITAGYQEPMGRFFRSNRTEAPAPASFSLAPQIYDAKAPVLEQIGSDSDWKSVSAGYVNVFALKKDGTLWGWGTNNSGVLGSAVETEAKSPVRIGKDSDWISVFAARNGGSCSAIKRDGSQWCWGYLSTGPNGESLPRGTERHVEPVLYPLRGTNWVCISVLGSQALALDSEGTLWGYGYMPEGGFLRKTWSFQSPRKIATREWRAVENGARIRRDGTLWNVADWSGGRKQSRNADWIAVASEYWPRVTALAADGTFSNWSVSEEDERGDMLPTRKPAWTFNILQAKNTP